MCQHTYDEYQRHPNRMSTMRIALFAAETILNLFSLLTGTMFFFILRKTVIMRRNPRMLLHNLLLSNLLTVLTRFVIVANMISEDKLISARVLYPVGFVHDVSINMNTLNQLCLALESTLSTFFTGLYKKMKCTWTLSLLECLLPWVIAVLCRIFEDAGSFPAAPRFLLFQAANVVSWLVLIALALVNRYFYQHCLPGDVRGKFDLVIRIRTLKTLNVLAVMTGMRNAITVGILEAILFHYTPRCDFESARMLAHLFDLSVSAYSAFFVFPLLYVNAEFAKHFDDILARRLSTGVFVKDLIPRNAIGQSLIISQDQRLHFTLLRQHWENAARMAQTRSRQTEQVESTLTCCRRRGDTNKMEFSAI